MLKRAYLEKALGVKRKTPIQVGEVGVIKVVAQAISTNMMGIFQLLGGLIDKIHSLIARFWWGNSSSSRGMHWKAWNQLCLLNGQGGLRFKDLKTFNLALLAKQLWLLNVGGDTLVHKVFKATYYLRVSVLDWKRMGP